MNLRVRMSVHESAFVCLSERREGRPAAAADLGEEPGDECMLHSETSHSPVPAATSQRDQSAQLGKHHSAQNHTKNCCCHPADNKPGAASNTRATATIRTHENKQKAQVTLSPPTARSARVPTTRWTSTQDGRGQHVPSGTTLVLLFRELRLDANLRLFWEGAPSPLSDKSACTSLTSA